MRRELREASAGVSACFAFGYAEPVLNASAVRPTARTCPWRNLYGDRLTNETIHGDVVPRRARLPSALAALLVFTSASAAAAQDVKRVLVLYPVSDGQPGILRFDESLRSALKSTPEHPGRDL